MPAPDLMRFPLLAGHAVVAVGGSDHRTFRLGAAGIRADGAIVKAKNGACIGGQNPRAHAEARLCRKLTPGSTVFVVRLLSDNSWANARPCPWCLRRLRAAGVSKVWYSISNQEVGYILL